MAFFWAEVVAVGTNLRSVVFCGACVKESEVSGTAPSSAGRQKEILKLLIIFVTYELIRHVSMHLRNVLSNFMGMIEGSCTYHPRTRRLVCSQKLGASGEVPCLRERMCSPTEAEQFRIFWTKNKLKERIIVYCFWKTWEWKFASLLRKIYTHRP